MIGQTHSLPEGVAPLLGDPHPLLGQIGPAQETAPPALEGCALQLQRVRSVAELQTFLESYQADLLFPVELPAILRAHAHTVRYQVRELIALDQRMAQEPKAREFAAASCRVGQRQLNRLRPLRDFRLVQRYRAAILSGEAHGWHTLVYGISLGLFSLPLRQGLLSYASHTLGSFLESATRPLSLSEGQCRELQTRASRPVAAVIEQLLRAEGASSLRVV
jgi:urease accessory protein UreF